MRRDDFTLSLDLGHELIIDNFAGGGGTSTGLEAAFGRPVDIAINHDPEALAMHAINHPHTLHLCESVWEVDPIKVTRNQPVALVWLSPDCKHFSKAKGGTPVSKHIRGLAWVGMRWVALCKPRVLMLENVEEFQTWGPLIVDAEGNARPDPAKKGKFFESFVRQLRRHGYQVDWRELRACDQGAPTIRKRLFLVARRDGLPITWPEQAYGEPTSREVLAGRLAPYRTAAECIDFSLKAESIFDRKKALAKNTQRRVAKGLWRHVLTSASPFIVNTRNGERAGQEPRIRGIDEPYWTVTGLGSQGAMAEPVLAPYLTEHAIASNQRTMPADEPLRTQLAQVKGGHFSVVAPHLAPIVVTNTTGHPGAPADTPLATIATGGHHALAAASITSLRGTSVQHLGGHDVRAPLSTVSAGGTHHALTLAHLVDMGHGERRGGGEQALVSAFLEQANGGFYAGDGRPAQAPMSTITAAGSNQQLVTAYCVLYYSSGGQWQDVGKPMSTLPTKGRVGLVQALQVPVDCLAPEHRRRARLCAELLHDHLPDQFPEPAELVLMSYGGQWWVLVDITLRMLKPPELFRAQGFPNDYVIHEIPDPALLFKGGVQDAHPLEVPRIPLSATAQVRMCGNSVSPPMAEALVRANFRHEQRMYGVAA